MINNDWSKEDEMTTDFNNRQYDEMYRSTSFIIDSLCHILPVDRTYNVIDVGTGAGANLYYIAKEYQNHNFIGVDFETAIGSVAATLGNVGPGIGDVGPSGTYNSIPVAAKWFLSLLMFIGRLELFTFLMIITPIFWTSR